MSYNGVTIDVKVTLEQLLAALRAADFEVERYGIQENFGLYGATRGAETGSKTVYISSGMHGDEPAGPLALLRLLEKRLLPLDQFNWVICPILNPVGLSLSQRCNRAGVDLNRDYLQCDTGEVRTHVAWLNKQPRFDLALLLHEDWESTGFYMNEFKRCPFPQCCPRIIDEVSRVCPVEEHSLIDGMKADHAVTHPWRETKFKDHWPESFYLRTHKTDIGFNFEAPSAFDLEMRVAAHATAVIAALDLLSPKSPVSMDSSPISE